MGEGEGGGNLGDFFTPSEERIEIEEQIGRIRLVTYDDLIAYGRSRIIEL
jgi:hypothetical protein